MAGRVVRRRWLRHPAQTIVVGFAAAILVGTALLMLPVASTGAGGTDFVTALFTSTSAVCVTGLVVVDTGTYWSAFGEVVILALIQLGGLGIMTFASVVGLLISRRMGLRTRLSAAAETKAVGLADIRKVVTGVVKVSLLVEAAVALVLGLRFWLAYDESPGRAAYLGVFHSISAFNNAGFALWADSLIGYVTDPWVCVPIALAVIFGGLGFPVWFELRREIRRPKVWSMHTKMTISVTVGLLVLGTVFMTASEWSNPDTLGAFSAPQRVFVGFFHAVMPRTAGFNSLDVGAMNDSTLLGTVVLMFIGGGSAGTAGGIKVTTFILLFFVIYAEVRGESRVNAFDRQVDDRVIRQALTVALLSVGAVVGSTLLLMSLTGLPLGPVLFEATSAFATVGLSTGITYDLPTSADLVLVGLMFLGRLGPITLVSALALRERRRHYELPEGRPIIG
ncbi:potassium transporter TrkG [Nocardioides aestuarii]|uniref:TrkH family potassium uptake protein n=1 Tax=Nocardioides aestuarii TaxID=252231 RepID=A0ABW4TQU1_9ACTN